MERLKIAEIIGAAQRGRLDMVNLPSVFGIGLAVVREAHDRTADIGSPEKRILPYDRLSFSPDLELQILIDVLERVCVWHLLPPTMEFCDYDGKQRTKNQSA
jgi:hypothetical protein